MPREQQKRGRRAAEKAKKYESKRKQDEASEPSVAKRRKSSHDKTTGAGYIPLDETSHDSGSGNAGDMPFYGLLDAEEQEYFSRANEVLELNLFADSEARRLFIENVYHEAEGKELKIACSQSCSRLLEKLISHSDIRQIRRLFNKFIGHFLYLVQHRFASHCCETLFIHAAPGVIDKLPKPKNSKADDKDDGIGISLEEGSEPELTVSQMFLRVVEELEANWGYLLTEQFASHTVRVLLLVLAGEPVDVSSTDSVIASRKKERLGISAPGSQGSLIAHKRNVPDDFETTLKNVMRDMVSGLDDTSFRALATHPTGNPVLQVLIYLELSHFGKSNAKESNSITRRLIPDDSLEEGSKSTKFVQGLLYDQVGSRLLETIIRWAPGKLFKTLYRKLFRERLGSLARNVIAGYVVVRILERLGKDDLREATETIIPEIPSLLERSRLIVPKTLIERSAIRGIDTASLAKAFEASYDSDPAKRLLQMLKLQEGSEEAGSQSEQKEKNEITTKQGSNAAEKLHGSLLAQAMLVVAGPLRELIFSGLLAQSSESLIRISKDPTASHVLQSALVQPTFTIQFRRQITSRFYGHMKELALDTSASHVVDTLWLVTEDLFFVKERMAEELVQSELALRDSFIGRAVWKNWSLDLYKRRRGEWKAKAKSSGRFSESAGAGHDGKTKSRIELARARFAIKAHESADAKVLSQPLASKS